MEPHRPPSSKPDSSVPAKRPAPQRPDSRRTFESGSVLPPGREWLEREAIRYLARWEATRQGVTEKLERSIERRCERSGEDADSLRQMIPELIEGLVERGYIDDRRYAEQVYARLRRQGSSRARIQARLQAKGIAPDVISEVEAERARARGEAEDDRPVSLGLASDEHNDEDLEAAWRIAKKRRLGPFHPDPDRRVELRQRHLAVLARQGFSSDVAYTVVDAVLDPVSEPERRTAEPTGPDR